MTKATQDKRLLAIATPLGKDHLVINKLRAEESLSELYEIDVELLFDEEDDVSNQLTTVDITQILGQAVNIRIRQEDEVERSFIGMVSRFTQLARDIRFTYYKAKIVPHVWKLTQNFRSRIFQQMSVRDILEEVLDGFETKMQLNATYKPRNYCTQYRETDFEFISRLMHEEGIYYYFDHSGEIEKMVLRDDYLKPEDCPGKSDIPTFDTDLARSDRWEGHISRWFIDYNLISGSYETWDYQSQLPLKKLDASMTSRFNLGGNKDLKVYDYPGGYGGLYDGVDSGGGDQSGSLDTIFEDNKKNAKNTMLSFDSQHQIVNGTSDCCALTPGYRFNLKNHPNDEYNIAYIVRSVIHEADQSPDYLADGVLPDAYSNKFTCIPHGEGHPEFRPVKTTKKKRIHGSQTAVVVGPEGEEIFTDKYGRVKVQFNWDQDGELDASSSCWVPVSQGWAGNKWGMVFTPRIGMEVVVDFLDGDPDRPIVQGCVYNPNTMPHYELPKYKTLSYIKSSSSPDDTKGFNEIRFEDKQGKEQVFIHSQKRGDIRIKGSFYETCGGNRQERIGVRSDNQPGGNLAVTVGGNYDLHVKAANYIGIDDKLNEMVAADVVEDYQANHQTTVSSGVEVNARNITLEALSAITLKVGGSFIKVDLTGVTIQGPMTKINSGGAAQGTGPATIADPLDAASADTGEPGWLDRPRPRGRGGRNVRTLNGQHAPENITRNPDGSYQMGAIRVEGDEDYQQAVLTDLATINTTNEGQQLLQNIDSRGGAVTIREQNPPPNPPNAFASPGTNTLADYQNATPAGQPVFDGAGNPLNDASGNQLIGTGTGGDSTVDYNPDQWGPGSSRTGAPGDAILFHELTHSDNQMNGTYDGTPRADNFDTQEEFNTIGPENRYRDERGIERRNDHHDL